MKLICPNCGELLDEHQKHGKRMCHICGCNIREIWNVFDDAHSAKKRFLTECGDLCFPKISSERIEWEKFLKEARNDSFKEAASISDFKNIVSKYNSKTQYYKDLQKQQELYCTIPLQKLIDELDLYSDSSTGFYKTKNGNIVYADNSGNTFYLGRIDFYTKGDIIVPCFLFDNQSDSIHPYSEKSIEIKIPRCSSQKSPSNGTKSKICDIERFSLSTNENLSALTVTGRKQKIKELQRQKELQKRQESMRNIGTFFGSIIISALIVVIGLLLIAFVGAIIGAISQEDIGLEPGFKNAFIGMINGELTEHVYASDGVVRMVFGLKYGGMFGCIIASIIAIVKNSIKKDELKTVALTSVSGLVSGIVAGIVLATVVGFLVRFDGWNGTTDYKTKIGAIVGGVIAGIVGGVIDEKGEVATMALSPLLVILSLCLLVSLLIRAV